MHLILHAIPHPILCPIPCQPVALAVCASQNLMFPKNFNLSTISEILVDWCRMGNRTKNRMEIRFACKSDRESDSKTYVYVPLKRKRRRLHTFTVCSTLEAGQSWNEVRKGKGDHDRNNNNKKKRKAFSVAERETEIHTTAQRARVARRLKSSVGAVYMFEFPYEFPYESANKSPYDLVRIRFPTRYESAPILNWTRSHFPGNNFLS
jgi:hypothetical protein